MSLYVPGKGDLVSEEEVGEMCEAHAYVLTGDKEKRILESVDEVVFEGDEVNLVNIFGEQKTLRARLTRYDSREGKLFFEAVHGQ